jgi:hypothetical protein
MSATDFLEGLFEGLSASATDFLEGLFVGLKSFIDFFDLDFARLPGAGEAGSVAGAGAGSAASESPTDALMTFAAAM